MPETVTRRSPARTPLADKIIVLKWGGKTCEDSLPLLVESIVLLRTRGFLPIIFHGGGPEITRMLKALGIETDFINGLRKTNEATLDVAEQILSGGINKRLSGALGDAGIQAVGLSGRDGGMIRAERLSEAGGIGDLGFVGRPVAVDAGVLEILLERNIVPVISPICAGRDGQRYNVNADVAAGCCAAALKVRYLLLLTDVAGVQDARGNVLTALTPDACEELIREHVVSSGMIPKIETAAMAVRNGVQTAVIMRLDTPAVLPALLEGKRHPGTAVSLSGSRKGREYEQTE